MKYSINLLDCIKKKSAELNEKWEAKSKDRGETGGCISTNTTDRANPAETCTQNTSPQFAEHKIQTATKECKEAQIHTKQEK